MFWNPVVCYYLWQLQLLFPQFLFVHVCSRTSHVHLFATPWTATCQARLSRNFSSKNTGLGCHFLLQEIFWTQGYYSQYPPRFASFLICVFSLSLKSLLFHSGKFVSIISCNIFATVFSSVVQISTPSFHALIPLSLRKWSGSVMSDSLQPYRL